jgi:hypothetical protein
METIIYSVLITLAVSALISWIIIIQIKKRLYAEIGVYQLIQNFLISPEPLDHINQLLCRGAQELCPEIKYQIVKAYKEAILKMKKSDFIERVIDLIEKETDGVCGKIASTKKSYIYEAINKTGVEAVAELLVSAARKIANNEHDCSRYESFVTYLLNSYDTPLGTRKEVSKITEKFAEGLASEDDQRIIFQAEVIKIKRATN